MKRVVWIGMALVAVGTLVGALLFFRTLRYGFSAHDEPTMIEALMARSMRRWAVPSDLRNVKNPVPLTTEVLAVARSHFADHCASCHGNDGKGQTPIGKRLYPKAPDMSAAMTQSLSDGELWGVIEKHVRGTPGFKPVAEWMTDIERTIAQATANRRSRRERASA